MCLITSDGVDYTGKSSVVSFPAGETSRSCPIGTIPDTFVERNDYFKANLSHPLNGPVVLGTPTMAFVNIIDDDGKLTHHVPSRVKYIL